MADGSRERIGRMIGFRLMLQMQQTLDHILHLLLVGNAGASHGLFDLHGGVLAHLKPTARACHKSGSARLGSGDGALRVRAEENLLDGDFHGRVAHDDLGYLIMDTLQAHGQRKTLVGMDAAVGTRPTLATARLDDTPAGVGKAGVDAENDQANTSRKQKNEPPLTRRRFALHLHTCYVYGMPHRQTKQGRTPGLANEQTTAPDTQRRAGQSGAHALFLEMVCNTV